MGFPVSPDSLGEPTTAASCAGLPHGNPTPQRSLHLGPGSRWRNCGSRASRAAFIVSPHPAFFPSLNKPAELLASVTRRRGHPQLKAGSWPRSSVSQLPPVPEAMVRPVSGCCPEPRCISVRTADDRLCTSTGLWTCPDALGRMKGQAGFSPAQGFI